MCGIVGAVAQRNVVPILIEGLKRLEYRGYDSAGLAIIEDGLQRVRSVGRVAELASAVKQQNVHGHLGIAHTRWATHGAPTERNAHPHVSNNILAVVHNGIIENHQALREKLIGLGYALTSETDTEVIVHLVHHYYKDGKDLLAATRKAVTELAGAYAIAIVSADTPDRMICARKGSPLLIGLGIEEHFVASDVAALLPVTQKFIYLEEGDIADVGLIDFVVFDKNGNKTDRPVHISELSAERAELGNYRHFMQKEIHEQPRALADTLEDSVDLGFTPTIFGDEAEAVFNEINSVQILACGTSYHAGMVARYWLEALAGIPCTVEIASEYRYRDSVPNPRALVVTISQSGETADTLAALAHSKTMGLTHSLAICNVPESALLRQSKLRFLTHAGPEIGVASTKAFTTQLLGLFSLTAVLAKLRGRLNARQEEECLNLLRTLPTAVQQVLTLESQIMQWAAKIAHKHHALFLGRGPHYPIALEGALKLKEISYIHAEAYPSGELKHGPLALVDEDMPIIALAPDGDLLEKVKSNLQEVLARGGELYVIADHTSDLSGLDKQGNLHLIKIPAQAGWLSPILHCIPLQMLAYHAALHKGTDVDKPRNLAKSVTVE